MILTPLILELAEILPLDQRESRDIARVAQLILSGAPLYRGHMPDRPSPHLVSYFLLVDPDAQAVLLGAHRKSGLWLPPGGHMEPDELPRDTVRRECREELRADACFLSRAAVLVTISETVGPNPHEDISLWYALRGSTDHLPDFDQAEYTEMRWFSVTDIPFAQSDPNLGRFLHKTLGHEPDLTASRSAPETALRKET
ncbi:MAG: NUDIX domain-containing protein [Roseinatronobacter sp.]